MTVSNSFIKSNNEKFIIRNIKKEELEEVYQMLQDLVRYEEIIEKFKLSKQEMYNYLFTEKFPWFCIVVEDLFDRSLKGFLLYTFSYLNRAFHLNYQVYIDHLYIKPEYRNLGAGTSLIKELEERLKLQPINRIEVWCVKTNKIGNNFYKNFGFKKLDVNIYQIVLDSY